jgi:arylsulfatase
MAIDGEPCNPPKEGFCMTDAITDHAVEFLGDETDSTNPCFPYAAYTAPHCPRHAPAEDIAAARLFNERR